jgi:hypothetical protein
VTATRIEVSGIQARYKPSSGIASGGVMSVWWRRTLTDGPGQIVTGGTVAPTVSYKIVPSVSASVWTREFIVDTNDITNSIVLDGRDQGGGTVGSDMLLDLVQTEAGKFPTSVILTTGATATRVSDRLVLTNGHARWTSGGRNGVEMRFVSKYARTDLAGNVYLWRTTTGTTDYAILAATGGMLLTVGGTAIASTGGTLSFNRGDVVDIYTEQGNGAPYARARVNGGAPVAFTFGSSHALSLPTSGDVNVMHHAGASNNTCWLQRISAFAPGKRPAWAA